MNAMSPLLYIRSSCVFDVYVIFLHSFRQGVMEDIPMLR